MTYVPPVIRNPAANVVSAPDLEAELEDWAEEERIRDTEKEKGSDSFGTRAISPHTENGV